MNSWWWPSMWNLDDALSSPLPAKRTKGSRVSATHCTQRAADCVCNTLVPETGFRPFAGASLPSAMQAAMDTHTHTHPYNTVKLGWGFVKPIARKTNDRFQSLRYSLHAAGGWLCMQHPGPRNGPPFWKPFLLPAILRPRFWGRFLAQFVGPRRSKQELLDGPDGPAFVVHLLAPAFLLQCKPPWTHTHRHTHTHIRKKLWGVMAQKLFWISEKGPLSRSARSHANLLRSGSMPPLQRLCQEAVLRASWEKCGACACYPSARFGIYYISAKRDVIPYLHAGLRGGIGTYEGRNHRWEGRNPLFTCGLEGRNRDVRGTPAFAMWILHVFFCSSDVPTHQTWAPQIQNYWSLHVHLNLGSRCQLAVSLGLGEISRTCLDHLVIFLRLDGDTDSEGDASREAKKNKIKFYRRPGNSEWN